MPATLSARPVEPGALDADIVTGKTGDIEVPGAGTYPGLSTYPNPGLLASVLLGSSPGTFPPFYPPAYPGQATDLFALPDYAGVLDADLLQASAGCFPPFYPPASPGQGSGLSATPIT